MSNIIELSATFQSERFRFENTDGDVIIAEATLVNGSATGGNNRITIKGKSEPDELQRNLTYRFYGRWTNYENKRTGRNEKQFTFQTFIESQPHGRAGIITYLKKAGKGNGIGHARAVVLWEKFGGKAVETLRESPVVAAAAVNGLKVDDAESAAAWLQERKHLEDATIEVSNLLDGKGFPKSTAMLVIKKFGNKAAKVIKKDPFVLMAFRGCGFKRCDNLYLELGHDPAQIRRQAFCAWYSIAKNSDGHTWFPAQVAASGVVGLVGSGAKPARAIKMAKRIGRIDKDRHGALSVLRERDGAIVSSGTKVFVAEGRKAWCEERIAEIVCDRSEFDDIFWPDPLFIDDISEHQAEILYDALQGTISILGGGPGTGKTFTAARLIKEISKSIGFANIAVAAPTGKAAVRITEAMQEYGIPIHARTWHSLLGMSDTSMDGGWKFAHDESNTWPYKLIIGDESSMIDTNLMSSIFRAMNKDCRLLLIGDVNQLPPVGHGAPLRDLIDAGLPYGELTEIKRNSGGIVEACDAIRKGEKWAAGDNLEIFEHRKTEDQIEQINRTLQNADASSFGPVWDCQVLVAVNEKSKLSRKEINKHLQGELNLNPPVKGTIFRLADKIVCLKNSEFPLIEYGDGEPAGKGATARVANGELGEVKKIETKYLEVKVETSSCLIRVPRGKSGTNGTGCNWDLAYALSVHKSQGSEWPVVIVMIDDYPGAKRVCSREWLYTAISRAKQKCILIGKKSVADAMCNRTAVDKRKTFLRELIALKQAEMEMAGL